MTTRELEDVLAEWRVHRCALLADLIDAISAAQPSQAITARGDLFHQAWLDRVKSGTDLGPALASITRGIPIGDGGYDSEGVVPIRYSEWIRRVDTLAKLPDDPRIAKALFAILRRGPYSSYYERDLEGIYNPAIELVVRIADERCIAPMRDLVTLPVARNQLVRRFFSRAFAIAATQLEQKQLAVRPLSEEAAAQARTELAGLGRVARRSAEEENTLFDLVVEAPEDDAPRAVLADYWLERGDPRGELISLQLDGSKDEKRIRAILRENEKPWCGDLTLVTSNRRFRRGFLDEITLLNNAVAAPGMWKAVALSPALRTVRTIHKGRANEEHYTRFLFSPIAQSLRRMTLVSKAMFRAACEHASPFPITELATTFTLDKKELGTLTKTKVFPHLKTLFAGATAGNVGKITPLLANYTRDRGLTSIGLRPVRWTDSIAELVDWLAEIEGSYEHLDRLEMISNGFHEGRLTVRRGERGLLVQLETTRFFFLGDILAKLHERREVEHVHLAHNDEDELRLHDRDQAKRVLDALAPAKISLDDAWTALFSNEPEPSRRA